MKLIYVLILSLILTPGIYSQWNYPVTEKTDSSETYFGETIPDPYQWLEDLENTKVKDWFKSEAGYTDEVISKIPNRDKLAAEMSDLDKVRKIKYSGIQERNGRFFFIKRLPGEETGKLFYREGISGSDILLFDPLTYQKGKDYNLGSWILSDNGKDVTLDITENGKERPFLKIMNVDSKTFYPEEIKAAYSGGFTEGSNNKIFYLKMQSDDVHKMESTQDSKYMMHVMGDALTKDIELMSRAHDPQLGIKPEDYPYITYDTQGNFIFAGKGNVDNNSEYYYAPKSQLFSGKPDWKLFCSRSDEITHIYNYGNYVYYLTSKGASNFKIMKTSLPDPDLKNAKLIFDGGDKKIESFNYTKDYIIITQIHNGTETSISKMNLADDIVTPVSLPLKGTIDVTPVSPFTNECSVWNSDWTVPANLYSLNLETNNFDNGPFNVPFNLPGTENIVSEEIEIPSYDGAMVPLSIVYDKTRFKKDGSNILFLDGYGAYGVSVNPYFNTYMLPMLNRGVIYAVAHVRGGGEKGESWYRAGWKSTKPNTWKDFIACGDYLVNNGYTSKDRLAGTGTSAGGVLIGRAITERPDLFKVAIPKVGCLNTLRGEFSPNGPINIPEFGSVKIKEEYEALKEMDSYEHLVKGEKYPATLITTGFNDPRVISWIPAKFAAKMQEVSSSGNPVLLSVDYNTGHFGGETMTDYFNNLSNIYSFIMWQCGHPDFQPKAN